MLSRRHNITRTAVGSGLLALFFLAGAGQLAAETVILHLRNGDRITGTLVSEDDKQIVLGTAWSKEFVLPKSEVDRRETPSSTAEAKPAPAPKVAAAPAEPKQEEPKAVEAQPKPETPTAKPTPAAPVIAKAAPKPEVKPKAPEKWKGEAQVGLDLLFGEKDRQIYYGRFKATYADSFGSYKVDRFRQSFDYSVTYGKTDGVLSANRMDGTSKTDFDIGQRIFIYNLIGGGYDEIRKIDLRYEVGPGLGYHLVKKPTFVMNVESGVNYQVQERANGNDTENFYYRFAEDFTWKINSRLTLDEKLEFFPLVEDFGEFRLRFESNLRFLVMKNLYLNLTVIDAYDTAPPPNVSNNDLQIRSSVSYRF